MRISDWSSDVCSSDLFAARRPVPRTNDRPDSLRPRWRECHGPCDKPPLAGRHRSIARVIQRPALSAIRLFPASPRDVLLIWRLIVTDTNLLAIRCAFAASAEYAITVRRLDLLIWTMDRSEETTSELPSL